MNTKSIKKFWSEQSVGTKLGFYISGLMLITYLFIWTYEFYTGIDLMPKKSQSISKELTASERNSEYLNNLCRPYPQALKDCATAGDIEACVAIKMGTTKERNSAFLICKLDGTHN